jgi:hypothetical protein
MLGRLYSVATNHYHQLWLKGGHDSTLPFVWKQKWLLQTTTTNFLRLHTRSILDELMSMNMELFLQNCASTFLGKYKKWKHDPEQQKNAR